MSDLDQICSELERRVRLGASALFPDPDGEPDEFMQRILAIHANGGTAWSRIEDVFRSNRKHRQFVPLIVKLAREKNGIPTIGGPPRSRSTYVRSVWQDAEVSSEAIIPDGWKVESNNWIYRVEKRTKDGEVSSEILLECSNHPLVIRRRVQNDNDEILLDVAWKTKKKQWDGGLYDREMLFSTREILKAAKHGLSVGSDNAMEIVKYLRAYENRNLMVIPAGYATSHMGWQGEPDNPTHHGFMCGMTQIGANGRAIEMIAKGGNASVAESTHCAGSFDAWKSAVGRLEHLPAMKILLYGSLASPLLAILRCSNAILELVGKTSRGKTTGLQLAASCWRSADSKLLPNWYGTINGFESMAAFSMDMPLLLDDTKNAVEKGKGMEIGKVIYQFFSGVGRTRADRDGSQRATATWRAVMISTGEARLTSLAKDEGAATRVLSLWGNPAGEQVTGATARMLREIFDDELLDNYGHAGPAVVRWLCANRNRWPELRSLYDATSSRVREKYSGAPASRLAKVIALLDVSSFVAAEAGCLPWRRSPLLEDADVMALIGSSMQHASAAADRGHEAWTFVHSYAESRPGAWIKAGTIPDSQPSNSWLGWYDDKIGDRFLWLPSQLRKALSEGHYDETVLQQWKDFGILVDCEDGRLDSRVRCGGPDGEKSTVRRQHRVCIVMHPPSDEKPVGQPSVTPQVPQAEPPDSDDLSWPTDPPSQTEMYLEEDPCEEYPDEWFS